MFKDLFSIIYPATCLNCNETLISAEKFICTSCKLDLPKTNDHQNRENNLYQRFAYEPLIKSVSAFLYLTKSGITRKLLHSLKYEGNYEIGNSVGEWYGEELAASLKPHIIIPVPIHRSKRRSRGYNQSLHFSKGLSTFLKDSEIREDLIFRKKKTSTQTRKGKVDRWKNMDNVYSDVHEDLSGRDVLIVDDVITTGATVGMLCDKLKAAGPRSLHIVCMARA